MTTGRYDSDKYILDLESRIGVLHEENKRLRAQRDIAEHWVAVNQLPLRAQRGKPITNHRELVAQRKKDLARRNKLAVIVAAAIRVYLWYFVQGIDPRIHPYALTKLFTCIEKELGPEFRLVHERKQELASVHARWQEEEERYHQRMHSNAS